MPVASKSARPVGRPPDSHLQERRRAEILDAATKVFSSRGFAAADVQEIADKTGVGKGTIYRYFSSKEELFLAAVDHGMRNLKLAVDAAAASAKQPGRILPVMLGLNGAQMFDPGARIHIWLPALSDAQWSELNPCLHSLATLTSLRIGGRHFASIEFPINPCEWMSANEANVGCWYPPLIEPLLVDAPELKGDPMQ